MQNAGIPSAAIVEELEKVISSDVFRSAARSSRLLRFLVDETLKGNAERLKDYTLGAEGLGRGDDFDPRIDPIARVEASRLRSRLEMYYAKEGASDALLIALPKGGYVPQFKTRQAITTQSPPWLSRWTFLLSVALAIFALIAIAEGAWIWWLSRNAASPQMRLEIRTPPTIDAVSLAVSPDGKFIVFVAESGGRSQLWLRPLDSATSRPLQGTDYAVSPFWAADGRSLGFFADGKLKRIDIDGGSVQTLSKVPVPAGGAWNRDGLILYPMVPDSPLFKISAMGGESAQLTTLEPHQTGHRSPQFLPDGRHFIYLAMGNPDVRGIYVGDVNGSRPRRLFDAEFPAVFSASGYLFFVNQGTLFAQKFDPLRLEIEGNPTPVAEHIMVGGRAGLSAVSASTAGLIAYRTGTKGEKRRLAWFDRSGKEIAKVGETESYGVSYISISPDEHRLAVQRTIMGNTDIWLLDFGSAGGLRFTTDAGPDISPIWSWRGDRIVFSSLRNGAFNLYQKNLIDAGGEAEPLFASPQPKQATDWSVDGRFLLFRSLDSKTDWDVWALPVGTDQKPFPVVRGNFEERDAQFSPDGKWIAYQSNESGRFEIYVQPFPGPGEKMRISDNGGAHARWPRGGKELFYLALDGQLISVPIHVTASGAVQTGVHTPLFVAHVGQVQDLSRNYIVSADGQRFLMDTVVEEDAAPISLILNWKPPSK